MKPFDETETAGFGGEPKKRSWASWRELLRDAVESGKKEGQKSGIGPGGRLRESVEKGVYDLSFGAAYGAFFGFAVAKEVVSKSATAGAADGAKAGQVAGAAYHERRYQNPVPSDHEKGPLGYSA